ncbi:MAG: rod shape-determining protein RodA [Pseudomonadota bacterium]
MTYLVNQVQTVPTGLRKVLYVNWPIVLLLTAVACVGFLMLTSVAGGEVDRWAERQMKVFAVGTLLMLAIAMVPIWFWRSISGLGYLFALGLLILVETSGVVRMGAQRWIDLGVTLFQPSELMKVTLVMALAAYYDWLPLHRTSKPLWVIPPVLLTLIPTALVLKQPDLGTAILLLAGGGLVMFCAGVSWWYFAAVIAGAVGLVYAVFASRGQDWQLIKDYQFRRIDTFLDPASDPLGAGYNITQSKIALGSGGWTGKGFMQGTQSRLNFLPEKHTDFIFTTLAEEFGLIGGMSLLVLYGLIVFFCVLSASQNKDRFGALLTLGIAATLFLFFAVNMSMVMGLAPVVGVPLPLVSFGGTAMLVLLAAFGLVQSAHVHRARSR